MGGKQSKDANHGNKAGSPDPVIPTKAEATSTASPPKEQVQTNQSSTVATSPSETSPAALHEESQLNRVQPELNQPRWRQPSPPPGTPPPPGADQFPNVTGPDTSRIQHNNPNYDGFYPPAEHDLDQEFGRLPRRPQGDQYWPGNYHTGIRYPQRDGREYATDGSQNRERSSSANGEQCGTLVYDNIVITDDPSKVVIGKRNYAGGKVGGRISGNRVIR